MLEERLFLEGATPDAFATWLDWHIEQGNKYFSDDKLGSCLCSLEMYSFKPRDQAHPSARWPSRLEIRIFGIKRKGGLPTLFGSAPLVDSARPAVMSPPHIVLEVGPPLPHGIEVIAECKVPAFEAYFVELLQTITEKWLRTAGDLEAQTTTESELSAIEQITTLDQYVFRKLGEMWKIVYEGGPPVFVSDTKGLNYVAFLLSHPGKAIGVIELVAAVEKAYPEADIKLDRDEDGWESGSVSVSDGSDDQEILDDRSRADYANRLHELQEERQQAEERGDETALGAINREAESIAQELKATSGVFRRNRSFSSPHERARTKVQKQIKAAIDKISEHIPALAQYLRRTISTGGECSYRPDPNVPISWRV